MKIFTSLFTVLPVAALLLAGCVNEEPNYRKTPGGGTPSDAKGFLSTEGMDMRVVYDTETETGTDDARGDARRLATRSNPTPEEIIVEILDAGNTTVDKKTYGEWKALTEPVELAIGNYTLRAYSAETVPEKGWDCPVYSTQKEFSIRKGETTRMPDLVCTLSNIKVTVGYAADLADMLSDDTSAEVALGANTLTFLKGDGKTGYFRAVGQTNTLEITITGSFRDTGKQVTLSKTVEGVRAGQWRKVTLIIENADKGDLEIGIVVDSFIQDEEIVIDGSGDLWEPVIDGNDPVTPGIEWGDNDLTAPFALQASMFDAEGNCTVPVALDFASPDGITALQVRIGSDNGDLLTTMGIPTEFDLCSVTPETGELYTALNAMGFPLGDAVTGHKTLQLDLTALMPKLYRFDGTHTFTFAMTDGQATRAAGSVTEATLTVVVDKQNENTGPEIVWEGYDIDAPQKMTADMKIKVNVTSESPITAFNVTIESKVLDPYLVMIELPTQFDLCQAEDKLAKTLNDLGFPTGSAVVAPLSFDISQFVELLIDMDAGEHKFILAVTDAAGTTTTKTLHLINEK